MGHALGNNYGKFYSFQSKPVLLDLQFVVDATVGTGTTNVKGQGVQNVFMHTSTTPSGGNPNPANGYALVQLAYNYTRVYGGPVNLSPPLSGSNVAINGSALTAGVPYQITDVGHGPAGTATINFVDDVSGAMASSYFSLYDSYGNTFIIWFVVSGVGSRPNLGAEAAYGTVGLHYVQQSIVTNDTDDTIADAVVVTVNALPSGTAGVFSFTSAAVTGTVTVTSTVNLPLAGPPADGLISTGAAFAIGNYSTNLQDWQGVGLPKGVTPAVGVSFIATATGYTTGGGSTGQVKIFGTTGVSHAEILNDPNLSLGPIPMGGSPNVGGWILVKLVGPSFAGTALGTHTHDLLLKNAAVADGATTRVNAGTNLLGANTGSDITVAGGGANGGIVAASAGTPAGTVSFVPVAPTAGTMIRMQFLLEEATRVGGHNE